MAQPKLTEREAPAVVSNSATIPQRTASRLPSKLRFPILLLLNFTLNHTLWSVALNFLPEELGHVHRVLDDGVIVALHLAYRVGYLYFTWKGGYDWMDVAALTTLTNIPYAYLFNTYYNISTLTTCAWVTFEVASIAFPTLLLRPLSPIHKPNSKLRNRFLLESFQVQTSTTLLAIAVYDFVLYTAVKSGWLNSFLVSHFDIPTVEAAYAETALTIAAKVAPIGVAARAFLLNPSIGAASGTATPAIKENGFDAANASLPETVKYNFGLTSRRTWTLAKRTMIMSLFMVGNTVHRTLGLQGSDVNGALGYAGVWVAATAVTAAWWAWVGDTEVEEEE